MTGSQVIGGNPTQFPSEQTDSPERVKQPSGVLSPAEQVQGMQWITAVEMQARNQAAIEAAQAIPHGTTMDAATLRGRIVTTTTESWKMLVDGRVEHTTQATEHIAIDILPTAREQMKGERNSNPHLANRKLEVRQAIARIAKEGKRAAEQTERPSAAVREATEQVRSNTIFADIISPHALFSGLRRFGEYLKPYEATYVKWGIQREEEKKRRAQQPIKAAGKRARGGPNTSADYGQETSVGRAGVVNAGG